MFDVISGLNHLCDKYGDDFNWGIVPQENGFPKYKEFIGAKMCWII